MTDSIEIQNIEVLPCNEKAKRDQIEEAKTTYQFRKKKLEESLAKQDSIIAKAKECLENYNAKLYKFEKTIQLRTKEIGHYKTQLGKVREKIQSNPNNQQLRQLERDIECEVAKKERELQEAQKRKEDVKKAIEALKAKIDKLQRERNKTQALYSWLVGPGARELERNNARLTQQADFLRKKYNLAKGRPGM